VSEQVEAQQVESGASLKFKRMDRARLNMNF